MKLRFDALMMCTLYPLLAASAPPLNFTSGLYDITIATEMPHLEESLRYATTREQRCLTEAHLTTLFPVLLHPSFDGCALGVLTHLDDRVSSSLICKKPDAAAGRARYELDGKRFSATLSLQMGGKNMTLTQRAVATRLGDCP